MVDFVIGKTTHPDFGIVAGNLLGAGTLTHVRIK